MLRVVTVLAVVAVVGMAFGLWQLQQRLEEPPPAPAPPVVAEPKPIAREEGGDEIFMDEGSRRDMLAAITTIVAMGGAGGQGALTESALVQADRGNLFLASDDHKKVEKLRQDYLGAVRDSRPVAGWNENDGEAASYCDALIKSARTLPAVFAQHARRDVHFVHLFEQPSRYRGDVIHIEGRLRLVTRYDAPLMAAQAGVAHLYEGWIQDERTSNPYCVILTELPPGVQLGNVDYPIAFDGYFFKRYRYKAVDSVKANQFREAPLLIGRTVALRQVALAVEEPGPHWAGWLLPGFMLLLAGSALLTVVLLWWFRREDRKVRERVAALYGDFVEPPPDPTPPLAPPVRAGNAAVAASSEVKKHHYTHGHDKARAVHRALGQGGIDSS
jgi:hypothetical protein